MSDGEFGIVLKMADFKRLIHENPSLVSKLDAELAGHIDDTNDPGYYVYDLRYFIDGFRTAAVCCVDDVIIIPTPYNKDSKCKYINLFGLLKDKYDATFSFIIKQYECV